MSLLPGCVRECPGCRFRELSVREGAARKREWLARALASWDDRIGEVRCVDEAGGWSYRDKTCLAAEWDGEGWKLGLRRRDEVIAIPECPVHSERVRSIVRALADILPDPSELPLAYVAISGRLLTLVVKSDRVPELSLDRLAGLDLVGVFANLNPSAGNRVFSSRGWKLLWGEPLARTVEGEFYGPDSFRQLIPPLHRAALDEARAFLRPGASSRVVDLCSGTGASLALWIGAGAAALGVELGGEAVACLEKNLGSGFCLRGRASERIPQLDRFFAEVPAAEKLVFANPPRLGLEREILEWIARMNPARIAYLSCSAGTLGRDLAVLQGAGYAVRKISPYDFFPRTPHVETLATLETVG